MDISETGPGIPGSLPPAIAAAWGLKERPQKGPRRALTVDRIVEAAIAVAESDGLAAVSMNRVAAEIGASTMALYRYVGGKDELLTLMMDVGGGLPPDPPPGADWRAGLEHWATALRAVYTGHPWLLRIPISGPPATPRQLAWMEQGLVFLRDSGLTGGEKIATIMLISGYVRSDATIFSDISAAAAASGTTPAENIIEYGRILAQVLDPIRFPNLIDVMLGGVLEEADDGTDVEFRFGLGRILDGIASLVQSRTG